MAKILSYYMTLVPTLNMQQDITLPNGSTLTIDNTQFFPILFGGDQLTVARVRGTQALRVSHDSPVDCLEGVVPIVEDWHARMTLMKVVLVYTCTSAHAHVHVCIYINC